MYYWILTTDKSKGNPFRLLGPYNSNTEAQRMADKVEVEYEIIPLSTANQAKATQMVKAKMADEHPKNYQTVTRNFKHGPSK